MNEAPARATVEAWLRAFGVRPGRAIEREGTHAWDLRLDGRRRRAIPVTVILAPTVGCVVWTAFAPPLRDGLRRSYRRLLRWNEEYPFVKFGLTEDERPALSAEVPMRELDEDRLGEALARCVAVCDGLYDEMSAWLDGDIISELPSSTAGPLLDRYADRLEELLASP